MTPTLKLKCGFANYWTNPPAALHLAEISLINAVGSCMGKNLKGNNYENPLVSLHLCVVGTHTVVHLVMS